MATHLSRERSWLGFNERVLRQAERPDFPLLERIRFLAIFASNLDEFFSARLSALQDGARAGVPEAVGEHRALLEQARLLAYGAAGLYGRLVVELKAAGIHLIEPEHLNADEADYFGAYLAERIAPPTDLIAPGSLSDLGSQTLYLAAGERMLEHLVRLPGSSPRLLEVPGREGTYVRLEALVRARSDLFFPRPMPVYSLRLTRAADLDLDEPHPDWEDVAHALEARLEEPPVRLEVETHFPWAEEVRATLGLAEAEVFRLPPPLDYRFLFALARAPRPDLLFPKLRPRRRPNFTDDPFAALERADVALYHPQDDFGVVERFLGAAARDPKVERIAMTLYRIGRESPLAEHLIRAARHGKDVAVFLEGRARFDELVNLYWNLRLKAAGVRVLPYPPQKVHAKALYVRRSGRGYLHLGTGNYNAQNGALYTDFSLFTAREGLVVDALEFFEALQAERPPELSLMRSGLEARREMVACIEAEAHPGGRVILKLNHLTDPEVLAALSKAADAGARVDLVVRSSLTLVREGFRARSVVGRFLEHARIAAFKNGGDWRVWAGSLDWMPRNFERRLELLFPVLDRHARNRVLRLLKAQLEDDKNTFLLLPDGDQRPLWGGPHDGQAAKL